MHEEDLKSLNLEDDDEYKVIKSQEEKEDFNIDNGFKVFIYFFFLVNIQLKS
jgi:hypothetical protein